MATLVRYNNFPALFDFPTSHFFGRPQIARYQKSAVPAVNVKEDETAFTLQVAVPGMKKEDFTINVKENLLTVAFNHETEGETQKENYTIQEFGYQSFERSFRLPKTVNVEGIQAAYQDGILNVTLPKAAVATPETKQIAIA